MISKIINHGIKFLADQQQKDGSFLSLTSTKLNDFTNAKTYHAIVPSNIVLSCLNSLESFKLLQKVRKRTAQFLLSQKSEHWSLNYWIRDSKEARTTPYPDDLDDTFCALAALYQYNPKLIDGSAMAKIVTLLTAVEEKEGGPYNMWLVPSNTDKGWKRIDLVVNSNIAYFLSLQDISLPNVNAFIEQAIENEDYIFPYCSIYPAIYFISRFYKGKKTKQIKDLLLSKRQADGKWENPLYTALAISSLFNLSSGKIPRLQNSIEYLISEQSDGKWKPYSFYIELKTKEKTYYSGSASLTTAFCLEALNKFKVKSQKLKVAVKSSKLKYEGQRIYEEIIKKAKQRFSVLDSDLKKQTLKSLEKTIKRDKDKQIVLMPYFFKITLNRKDVSDDLLIELGLANLYGWISYTIYDDFLDDEGDSRLLSVANLCLRELTTIFNSILPKDTGFVSFFRQIMDGLDSANTWEVSSCRFPPKRTVLSDLKGQSLKLPDYKSYSKLAERSLGHALGPAAILFSLGYNTSSSELKNLMKFFKHYLIARQLNDDAHDWERDLKMGQINAVGVEILKRVKSPQHQSVQGRRQSKVKSNELFQQVFWYDVVVGVCQTVLKHVQLARKCLKKISVIKNPSLLEKLLQSPEKSAHKALLEREETIRFLKEYESTE